MKVHFVSKICLVFLLSIISIFCNGKIARAETVSDNSGKLNLEKTPDKGRSKDSPLVEQRNGRKPLIEIEIQTGKKGRAQKQRGFYDIQKCKHAPNCYPFQCKQGIDMRWNKCKDGNCYCADGGCIKNCETSKKCRTYLDCKCPINRCIGKCDETTGTCDLSPCNHFCGGRPFLVEGKHRMATSSVFKIETTNDNTAWKLENEPQIVANSTLNKEIAMNFANQGEAEHASVASFARHTLQLMTMGAPSSLLMGSQIAALDEIRHAKMSYGLSNAFSGAIIHPSTLDVDGSVKALSKEDIIQSVINEGCIGETIAAVGANLGASYAKQPMVKDILKKIAADESNHAQLAWTTVKWAINRFPELRNIVEETFEARVNRPIITSINLPIDYYNDCEHDSALHDHGLLVENDQLNAENFGIRNVIEPVVQNEFKNVETISTQILNMDFSKF